MAGNTDNSPRKVKRLADCLVAYVGVMAATALILGSAESVFQTARGGGYMPLQSWPHRIFAYGWFGAVVCGALAISTAPLRWVGKTSKISFGSLCLGGPAAVIVAANLIPLFTGEGVLVVPFSVSRYFILPVVITISLGVGCYFLYKPILKFFNKGIVWPALAVVVWATGALLSYAPHFGKPKPRVGAPDIILITIDTLRADAIKPRREGDVLMPNLETFRRRGWTFTAARTPAPWTRPALAAMLTGLPPTLHLYRESDRFDPALTTLPEQLHAAGYDTAAVVSNRVCEPEFGFIQGFDDYYSARLRGFAARSRIYWTAVGKWGRILRDTFGALRLGKKYFFDMVSTPRVTNDALNYLNRGHSRPYFLWVHYFDPHAPYTPPPRYVGAAARPYANDYWNYADNVPLARQLWEGEARYVDENLRYLLETVDRRRRDRPAVIIVTSDHGEEFGEHGGTSHGHTLHAELLHIPLVMVAPGYLPAGGVCSSPVSLLDIMPTVLEISGAPIPKYLVGQSLLNFVRNGDGGDRKLFGEALVTQDDTRSVETAGWKLIWRRAEGATLLYDVQADGGEKSPVNKPFVIAALRRDIEEYEHEMLELRQSLGLGGPREDKNAAAAVRALGYVR